MYDLWDGELGHLSEHIEDEHEGPHGDVLGGLVLIKSFGEMK